MSIQIALGMKHCRIDIVKEECTPAQLVIRDVGPWDKFLTVTNAAEGVVEFLTGLALLPPGRKLFYYDSDGQLDELKVDARGQFAGFAPGPGRSS